MIIIENVTFCYKSNYKVFENFNLFISRGCTFGLLGHNGAGKTTLLRLIAGVCYPQKGVIRVNNALKLNKLPRNYISYMPEIGGLYENLTIQENIFFRAKAAKVFNKNFKNEIEYILNQLELKEIINKKVGFLSYGFKKRALLACALVVQPEILLLDEPTNGIDPKSVELIIRILQNYSNQGRTIIISSHDLYFIEKICTNIAILKNGKITYSESVKSSDSLRNLYMRYS